MKSKSLSQVFRPGECPLLFSLYLGRVRWLSGRLWVKRERCHSQSLVIENIHEHCIERGIYAASHDCAGTPALNALLQFILDTTTVWAGVEACSPLNPLPPCKAKSRPLVCACALSALVRPACAPLPPRQPLESVPTNWLLCCSSGMTVTRPHELCMCCLFGIAYSSGYLSLPLLDPSVLYWGAFFSTLPKPHLLSSSPTARSPCSTHLMCYVWFLLSVSIL